MDIGSAIKLCREKRNLSQKELAQISTVSVSHLCLIEKSKREASFSTLELLSNALKVPTSIIILIATDEGELDNSSISLDRASTLAKKLIDTYLG